MILFKSKGLALKGSWAALIPKSTEIDKWWTCIEIQSDILVTLRKNIFCLSRNSKYPFCISPAYNTISSLCKSGHQCQSDFEQGTRWPVLPGSRCLCWTAEIVQKPEAGRMLLSHLLDTEAPLNISKQAAPKEDCHLLREASVSPCSGVGGLSAQPMPG